MDSAARVNLTPNTGHAQSERTQGGAAPVKIRLALKVLVFCLATVTLSWFFEGLRQVKEALTITGVAILSGGTILTIALVALMGFFTYCEERSKGNRIKNIALYDQWYLKLVSKQKGDNTNRG